MPDLFNDEAEGCWEDELGQHVIDILINLRHRGYTAERLAEEILGHHVIGAYFANDELDDIVDALTPVVADYHTYRDVADVIEEEFFDPILSITGDTIGWRRS